jgi:spermidine synthase
MDGTTIADRAAPGADVGASRGPPPALFALAVFTSAALVFIVEPMLARMILPKLGGSSAVWNTCLAFFQAALLLGYAYAHWLQRIASIKRQMAVHLAVLALAALALPLRITGLLGDPAVDMPALWLIGVLAVSVGAPFAALSATAPLIQAWYARLHAAGERPRDPYVLYAASNLGSLLALLAYPLLVEPFARLGTQSFGWTAGYVAFAALIAVVALAARRAPAAAPSIEAGAPASWRQRLAWLLLAAIPSSLLLGVTGHITADVASAPFLWVIPLALYLVTFIVAFRLAPGGAFDHLALLAQVLLLPEALLLFSVAGLSPLVQLPVDLAAFYFTAQVCAFALARRRPDKARLTEFYLWMSIGGVLGGSFNAFVAPVVFNGVWEYPLVLVLSALARPSLPGRLSYLEKGCLGAALACCALLLALPAVRHLPLELSQVLKLALMLAPAICVIVLRGRTLAVTVVLAALAVTSIVPTLVIEGAERHRSFFGVIQVKTRLGSDGQPYRVMVHGSTIHGTEHLGADRCQPTTYYTPRTPMGQVFHTEQERRPSMTVGTVGLGSGSVATYVRPGDHLTFFEIDPAVRRIALDPSKFFYVRGCARGPVDVVMGDARLSLEKTPAGSFDLLMVDAFSSDSVPTHLMTEQAMRTYLRVLKPGGLVMLHLSNRNLDLGGVAEASMRRAGGYTLQQLYWSNEKNVYREISSQVLIAAPDPATLQPYVATRRWTYDPPPARAWTDDYINVVGAMWSRLKHG